LLEVLADSAPTAHAAGIAAGLRVLLELPPSSPPSSEIAERALAKSISLFPLACCYRDGRIPDDASDALVLGYASLPQHEFERGIAALGELLEEELGFGETRRPDEATAVAIGSTASPAV